MLNTAPHITQNPLPGLMPASGQAPATPQDDGPAFAQVLDQAAGAQRGPRRDSAAVADTSADAPAHDDTPMAHGPTTNKRNNGDVSATASTRQAAARKAAWPNAATDLPVPHQASNGSERTSASAAPAAPTAPEEPEHDGQQLLDLATLMSVLPLPRSATSDSALRADGAAQRANLGGVPSRAPRTSLAPGAAGFAADEPGVVAEKGSTLQFLQALGNATTLPAHTGPAHASVTRDPSIAPGTAASSAEAKPGTDAMLQAWAASRPQVRHDTGIDSPGVGSAAPLGLGMMLVAGANAAQGSGLPALPMQAEIHAALGTPEFAPALGSQLSVLVRDGVEHAQLKLNPADMGPIEVRISLDGTQAQVDFSAAQAGTRQALQDAVPALASALRESGLTLTGGGVFEQPREQRGETRQDAPRHGAASTDATADAARPAASTPRMPRARGAVDLYA